MSCKTEINYYKFCTRTELRNMGGCVYKVGTNHIVTISKNQKAIPQLDLA